jgi:DNA-binding beta-propeller fold protein YncE
VRLYDGPAGGLDAASALAASPAGKVIFVTGVSASSKSSWDYATVAYAAGTGARLWVRRYTGPGKRRDQAAAVAVSPGGSRVFVTGSSRGAGSGPDYATVAYAAGTGAQLWARRYDGSAGSIDDASSAAVSPDGKTVFVAGQSFNSDSGSYDCVTIAYNAATGARQWLRRYRERVNINDLPCRVAVGPAGRNVYVTGAGLKAYSIVAYGAATGRQLWTRRLARSSHSLVQAASVAVSPGGARVYLTGEQIAAASAPDYLTVAYSAATGTRQWARRYNGTGNGSDVATFVAVSRDGRTVFVTGYSDATNLGYEYATLAYNAATGTREWLARYHGSANRGGIPSSMAVSPGGGTLYVTGTVEGGSKSALDYGTVAYSTVAGSQRWTARYTGPEARTDQACCVAVSPSGSMIFVTGSSERPGHGADYATVGYHR